MMPWLEKRCLYRIMFMFQSTDIIIFLFKYCTIDERTFKVDESILFMKKLRVVPDVARDAASIVFKERH